MHISRINFLDLHFDRLSFFEVTNRFQAATSTSPYQYLVTPNVDHVVRVHREPALRKFYDEADLCVCDSRVLKLLARLRGIKLPLVAGSDLSAALFAKIIKPDDRIAIVGADEACIEQMREKFPEVLFLHFEAPMNLRTNAEARNAAAAFIASSGARFTFIAVGSPQQEMIAREVRRHASATGVALCIGAALEFITGKQKRAPVFLQKLGLEWAHRLLSNPRRLWHRYMIDGLRIFPIWVRWRLPKSRFVFLAACASFLLAAVITLLYFNRSNSSSGAIGSSLNVWLPPPPVQSAAAVQALPPADLLKPLTPEQASKQNAERPFVGRPDTPAAKFILRADANNRERALTCLAQAVYYEAAGEGVDGGRAVAQVVLNRLRHPGFPSTVCGVVYEGSDRPTGCQFSFTCDGSMQRLPVPWLWARSRQIAEEALAGRVFAPVGHATHYHADYVLPYWADSLDKSVQLGRHIFYRLRRGFGDARAFSQRYDGPEPPLHEPGKANVIPQSPEGQQIAEKLIAGESAEAANRIPPGASKPATPLIIDGTPSSLVADGTNPVQARRLSKSPSKCGDDGDPAQLSPMKADELRATSTRPTC